ncbi:sushi domain protein [Oesophagostomum dentatum]|uniref:Sushi domain protein n=1 Tax=Oesophagostomum dentatum TaxID=61180 RepID=A0A0B1T3J6_OESDE|nr:sushi domain protein [Oesophagostomum dentatum]
MIVLVLFAAILKYADADCPAPSIPSDAIIDNTGPYPNGATINARCKGNGYFLGPSFMTCVFGNWAPPFLGKCSNGPEFSCPTPQAPEGAHLSRQGPFGNGDTVEAICDKGGHIIGVSSMGCVMGNWAPSFFGECTTGPKYSCTIPSPKPGMSLSHQGVVPSEVSVTATCTEDMKVLTGIKSITCVLGRWAPNKFGDCVDVNKLGKVVYSDGKGQVIVKYRNETDVQDLGNGELLVKYSSGGYGIEQVKGYRGTPDSEGHQWKIVDGVIYRDGANVPSFGFNYGTIRLSGFEVIPQNKRTNILPGTIGVTVLNNVLYINGVPVARRTGSGSQGIFVNTVSGGLGGVILFNDNSDSIIR